MVPKSPVFAPEARRIESTREVVVVFPFVPVTPTSFRAFAGRPRKFAAVIASAFRGSLTCNHGILRGQSAGAFVALNTAVAPRDTASLAYRLPSVATP